MAGERCERFMEQTVPDVRVTDLELDECWTIVTIKEAHKRPIDANNSEIGDQYVFVALDRSSRLALAWHLGRRDQRSTNVFIEKVRAATVDGRRFDVSTDALYPYNEAINVRLWDHANHSIVVKVCSKPEETRERYSPGDLVTVEKSLQRGNPDLEKAGTSHIERKNGSLRQWCKRLTRLTYAFSKKKENLIAALALRFWFYNFARIHGSLKIAPAMESGITDRVRTMSEPISS